MSFSLQLSSLNWPQYINMYDSGVFFNKINAFNTHESMRILHPLGPHVMSQHEYISTSLFPGSNQENLLTKFSANKGNLIMKPFLLRYVAMVME